MEGMGLNRSTPLRFIPTKTSDRQVVFLGNEHVAYIVPLHSSQGYGAHDLKREGMLGNTLLTLPNAPQNFFQQTLYEHATNNAFVQIRTKLHGDIIDANTPDFATRQHNGVNLTTADDLGKFMAWLHKQDPKTLAPHLSPWSMPQSKKLGIETIFKAVSKSPLGQDRHVMAVLQQSRALQHDIDKNQHNALVHGDLIPRNYLVSASTGNLKGVLDWEMSHLNDPHFDFVRLDRLNATEQETARTTYKENGGQEIDPRRVTHYRTLMFLANAAGFQQQGNNEHWGALRAEILKLNPTSASKGFTSRQKNI